MFDNYNENSVKSLNNLIGSLTEIHDNEGVLECISTNELNEFLESLQSINNWIDELIHDDQGIDYIKMNQLLGEFDKYFCVKVNDTKEAIPLISELGKPVTTENIQ